LGKRQEPAARAPLVSPVAQAPGSPDADQRRGTIGKESVGDVPLRVPLVVEVQAAQFDGAEEYSR
jgi:hypothetical protein